jgi:aminopeptidase N
MRALHRLLLFALAAALMPIASARGAAHLDMAVALDPLARTLAVEGSLRLPPGQRERLRLNASSRIDTFTLDGRPLAGAADRSERGVLLWPVSTPAKTESRLEFRYTLPLSALDAALDHRQVLGLSQPLAGAEGVFVPASSVWYPQTEHALASYRVAISAPPGFRAVISGALVEERADASRTRAVFESRRPLPGIDLLAGPYEVAERTVKLGADRSVRLRTYFHPELQSYAERYLDSAARYIARYDRLIGAYAHPAYSIVSAPIPSGFGMPGIAYLGRQVIRLPFIPATSLGHEVLHDWWGNGVYPDYRKGNWSEGLTTFLADYAFKEEEGAAAAQAMRLGWLRDYAAVPADRDRALAGFVSRRHGADQAVGYNKTAFVFFMLRDLLGEERFDAALRSFWQRYRGRVASWADIEREFSAAAGRDLHGFFQQWVHRTGAPKLRIASARRAGPDGERVRVRIEQESTAYDLQVPVRIHLTDGGYVDMTVPVLGRYGETEVSVPPSAQSVSLDADARLFRRLDPEEIAPTLRQVMFDARTLIVAGSDATVREAARTLAQAMLEHEPRFVAATTKPAPNEPLLIVGLRTEIESLLASFGLPPVPESLRSSAAFAYAERAQGRTFAVVAAPSVESLAALARPLPHLGGQSYAVFDGSRSVSRGVWPRSAPRVAIEAR